MRAEITWKNPVYDIEDKLEPLLDYREKPKEIKIKRENYLCKAGVRNRFLGNSYAMLPSEKH